MSRSIYALESKELRSPDEEQQLQQLLLSRSNLLDKLKAESAAAAAPSSETETKLAAASHSSTRVDTPPSSILFSIFSSVADVTHASVGLAKSVAGLLIDSAADTARLCTPPPPSLEQTLKQLDGSAASLPLCILNLLPSELQAAPPPPPVAATQVLSQQQPKNISTNLCRFGKK